MRFTDLIMPLAGECTGAQAVKVELTAQALAVGDL